MLLGILLALQIIVSLALIGVVLLQRSEGGVFGTGGGPTGFMTARGAGDLLTRTTWILGSTFFILSLALTVVSARAAGDTSVVDRLKVDAIDPSTINKPKPAEQAPAPGPAPLEAPAPQMRDPLSGQAAPGPAMPVAPTPAVRQPVAPQPQQTPPSR